MSSDKWTKKEIISSVVDKALLLNEIKLFKENGYANDSKCGEAENRYFVYEGYEYPLKYIVCRAFEKVKKDFDEQKKVTDFNPDTAWLVMEKYFIGEVKQIKKEKAMNVINDNEMKKRIKLFLERSVIAKKQGTTKGIILKDIADHATTFMNYKVSVSFGNGYTSNIPWMTFLKNTFTTQKGVYPYIGADVDNKSILIQIGFSENNKAEISEKSEQEILQANENNKGLTIENVDFDNLTDEINEQTFANIISVIKSFETVNFENTQTSNSENPHFKVASPLNQILYGPPGTGKTYNTINKALKIILIKEKRSTQINHVFQNHDYKKNVEDILNVLQKNEHTPEDRKLLMWAFDYYKNQSQIVFTTFHQSFGYEEFVEGIKAKTIDKAIEYKVENGIFKKLCIEAQDKIIVSDDLKINLDKTWKVSLGGSGNNEIKNDCYRNSRMRFGYKEDFPNSLESYDKLNNPLNALFNKMTIGDVVVSLNSNKSINQIGIVSGDYEYLENENDYKHSRAVRWLFEEPRIVDFYEINNNSVFSNPAIHEINPNREKLLALIPTSGVLNNNADKNYILIIDEINRGNISKIFGELITLIEDSKRIGTAEEIRVSLPYSGMGDDEKGFGVPSNLYIIGTMNTADRSIAPIDTALRRRFVFEEMLPKSELLTSNLDGTGINLNEILTAINTRIEYLYDRDHTIGHAYLIGVETFEQLIFAFKNKIIPLLAEYFYEDWENIDRVLNKNGFIISIQNLSDPYLKGIDAINGKKIYSIKDSRKWELKDFVKIYSGANNPVNETDVKQP